MNKQISLAIASIPLQLWETPYDPPTALKNGTVFPSLNLQFYVNCKNSIDEILAGGDSHQ